MKCVVLAAGYATRLYPLTENFPKPLLKVQEKTILDWIIGDLDTAGLIDEYVVVSNHKFYDIFKEWAEGCAYSGKVTVLDDGTVDNEHRLGAVKDIAFAIEKCEITEPILVVAGDNLTDFSLKGSTGRLRGCTLRLGIGPNHFSANATVSSKLMLPVTDRMALFGA